MTNSEILIRKIIEKEAKVAVVGLGYVGLPLAVEKAKVGFEVIGIDQNIQRVNMINNGTNYIKDVDDDELKALVENGKITATSRFDRLIDVDVIVICVPAPLTINKTPGYILYSKRDFRNRKISSPRVVSNTREYNLSRYDRGNHIA